MNEKSINKEQLELVYKKQGSTSRDAAKELGISHKVFRELFKAFDVQIKKRVSKFPLLADKLWLSNAYSVDKKSVRQIAVEAGSSVGAAESALKWAGVEMRTVKEGVENAYPGGRIGPKHPSWKGGRKIANTNGRIKSDRIKASLTVAFPDGRAGD